MHRAFYKISPSLLLPALAFALVLWAFEARCEVAAADGGEGEEAACVSELDCDGDGIPDTEEGDLDGDGKLGSHESDPMLSDTDGDGVPDGVEARVGTMPGLCDTDEDGLSDGVELGFIKPDGDGACHGLQPVGSNYRRLNLLDPLNPDSDGDGLMDGEEDQNGNGWVDPTESDPSIVDTDGDGLEDGLETLGDFDGDGIPDYDYRQIKAGQKCSPPDGIADVDCDGIPNARDSDSDNDGCLDNMEGGWLDKNSNGIPDIFDNQARLCPEEVEGSASGTPSQGSTGEGEASLPRAWEGEPGDGGACLLIRAGAGGEEVDLERIIPGMLMLIVSFLIISLSRNRRRTD